jgi:molybdenum cofactor synthesis domain-containing protein
MSASPRRACVLIIGNEILSGRTQDTNLPFLGRRFAALGVLLAEARVLPDEAHAIVEALNDCRRRYDYVFTTGGIGPTHDDITSAAVARAFNVDLVRDAEAVRRLSEYYGDEELNAARLKMADIPRGATLIDNPISAAPGFQMDNVFVLAGIPEVMQVMFESIVPRLARGQPIVSLTVTTNLREGRIADRLKALQERYPGVSIGSYPFFGSTRRGVNLVMRGTDQETLSRLTDELESLIRDLGGKIGTD